ncbi:MAG: sigma-54-dependent Fis family transcriptional regulator [candidate division Zixibacteria bacterium]|nr:sigma-54-dependent Fis family transcriptional regulator [candidate division Zixibacteria bacterium]
MNEGNILIIDDEQSMCQFMEIMLQKEGYEVSSTTSATEAINRIKNSVENQFDLVIADLMMPEMSGIELLEKLNKKSTGIDFVIMTAFGSVETAIEALKKGASEYITKPFKIEEVKHTISKCLEKRRVLSENIELRRQLSETRGLKKFIGNSPKVIKLKKIVERVSNSESTVLITGESGSGKELIARAIHDLSPRFDKPFVSINCGALPETLLESELFGYKKGAFTGADKDKIGLIKSAENGSFFLDELGNMPHAIQVKLLRVLEQRELAPLGSTSNIPVNIRLIAATNSDLESEVKNGNFRPDLYYRLNVLPVKIPPLRERKEDIPLLASHFIERFSKKIGGSMKRLSEDAILALKSYHWPGNVRELENIIEQALLLSSGEEITLSDIPETIRITKDNAAAPLEFSAQQPSLMVMEEAYILYVLNQTGWNKSKSAKILGIDTSTLYRKIDRYRLKEKANIED